MISQVCTPSCRRYVFCSSYFMFFVNIPFTIFSCIVTPFLVYFELLQRCMYGYKYDMLRLRFGFNSFNTMIGVILLYWYKLWFNTSKMIFNVLCLITGPSNSYSCIFGLNCVGFISRTLVKKWILNIDVMEDKVFLKQQ